MPVNHDKDDPIWVICPWPYIALTPVTNASQITHIRSSLLWLTGTSTGVLQQMYLIISKHLSCSGCHTNSWPFLDIANSSTTSHGLTAHRFIWVGLPYTRFGWPKNSAALIGVSWFSFCQIYFHTVCFFNGCWTSSWGIGITICECWCLGPVDDRTKHRYILLCYKTWEERITRRADQAGNEGIEATGTVKKGKEVPCSGLQTVLWCTSYHGKTQRQDGSYEMTEIRFCWWDLMNER